MTGFSHGQWSNSYPILCPRECCFLLITVKKPSYSAWSLVRPVILAVMKYPQRSSISGKRTSLSQSSREYCPSLKGGRGVKSERQVVRICAPSGAESHSQFALPFLFSYDTSTWDDDLSLWNSTSTFRLEHLQKPLYTTPSGIFPWCLISKLHHSDKVNHYVNVFFFFVVWLVLVLDSFSV